MTVLKRFFLCACLVTGLFTVSCYAASQAEQVNMNAIVNKTVKPLMQKYMIPGMAIGITINGDNYFYNYGVASKKNAISCHK